MGKSKTFQFAEDKPKFPPKENPVEDVDETDNRPADQLETAKEFFPDTQAEVDRITAENESMSQEKRAKATARALRLSEFQSGGQASLKDASK